MDNNKQKNGTYISADPTRTKILKAARKLFTAHGFAGTAVGKVALKAKVNHSLIFHHFDNKEGLWKATKKFIVEESEKNSKVLPSQTLPFPEFLKRLFIQSIEFYRSNPDLTRLINWQRLERSNKKDIGVSLSADTKVWLAALAHYQKAGIIKKNTKLEFLLTAILSLMSSAALDPNVFIKNEKDFLEYVDYCVQSILKMIS